MNCKSRNSSRPLELTDYPCAIDARCGAIARRDRLLHSHRLPFVTQGIQRRVGRAGVLTLSGQVATSSAAETPSAKRSNFSAYRELALDNQIQIEPNLATREIPPAIKTRTQTAECIQRMLGTGERSAERSRPSAAGRARGMLYTHDSGRFCYQRGADGNYVPSFSSLRLTPGLYGTQTEQWSRLELVSTDGVASMRMRFLLHHKEAGRQLFRVRIFEPHCDRRDSRIFLPRRGRHHALRRSRVRPHRRAALV